MQAYCQFCDPNYIKRWLLNPYGNLVSVLLCQEPVVRGHLLIVPQEHIPGIGQIKDLYLWRTLQEAAQFAADKLRRHLDTVGFNLGYDERDGHFKIHVVPWVKRAANPSMGFSSIFPPRVPHPTPPIKRSRELDNAKAETLLEEFKGLFSGGIS